MKKVCGVVWCYTGPEAEADKVFKPVEQVGSPLLHGVHAMAMGAAFLKSSTG